MHCGCAAGPRMSILTSKADIRQCDRHFRLGPIADAHSLLHWRSDPIFTDGSSAPSGINTLAFGFRSVRSPRTKLTTLVLGVVVTTFVPPLYSTVKLFPSTLLTLFSPILLGL